MSAFIRTLFILVGFYAGKTVQLGGHWFTDGKLEVEGTPEDVALLARSLERNWQAYPEGHPALQPQAQEGNDDGQRDLSPDPELNGQSPVPSGVQPDGEGSAAGGEGADNGGAAGADQAGASAELAGGDGQPPSLTDAEALAAMEADAARREAEEAAAAAQLQADAAAEAARLAAAGAGKGDPLAEVNTKLKKAVAKLDPANDDHWTREGLPAMKAVEAFYGSADITRADVEAVAKGLHRSNAPALK